MKLLVLIISSNNSNVYEKHRDIWRSYMKRYTDIDCFFIEYMPFTVIPFVIKDTLKMRGKEDYTTILEKTVDAINYFLPKKYYDYVVRTNLSCVWDFPRLLDFLQDKPRTGWYSGEINNYIQFGRYASGAGFIMSRDVAIALVNNKNILKEQKTYIDDVDIGKIFKALRIEVQPQPRVNFLSLNDYLEGYNQIPPDSFHYRVRWSEGREGEPSVMKKIVDSIYK